MALARTTLVLARNHKKNVFHKCHVSTGRTRLGYRRYYSNSRMDLKKVALESVTHGIEAVKPQNLIKSQVKFVGDTLTITSADDNSKTQNQNSNQKLFQKHVKHIQNVLIVGAGKATGGMCQALLQSLRSHEFPVKGLINVPHGQEFAPDLIVPTVCPADLTFWFKLISDRKGSVRVNFSAHPTPDEHGLKGARDMVELISKSCHPSTLLFVLISGGGSALLPLPAGTEIYD